MSQTQQQRVLNYLKENGSINPLVSLMELSVYRLSDTIFKLRENHNIETKMTKTTNRFSEPVSYATYVYKGEKNGEK